MRLRKHYNYIPVRRHVVLTKSVSSHTRWKKSHKTGPNRCITNSKEGTQRKMYTVPFIAWFVSLVLLMLSWKITNVCQKPASDTASVSQSVGSPLLTQFEWVNADAQLSPLEKILTVSLVVHYCWCIFRSCNVPVCFLLLWMGMGTWVSL